MEEKNEVRLQKFLADNGIASRRKCDGIILEGRVFSVSLQGKR